MASSNTPTPSLTTTISTTNANFPSSASSSSFYESEPPFLAIGTEVSAKYKGAFCEARIQKVQRLVKCRVSFKNNLGAGVITDENIKGALRVGATVEAKHPDKHLFFEATISKIIDASLYTVVFDDGDVTTLRRTSLCLKSGKHFSESESLDHLPLTNPEHFGNPVNLGVRGGRKRRRRSIYGNPALSDNEDNDSFDGLPSGGSVDDEDSNSLAKGKEDSDESGATATTNTTTTTGGGTDRRDSDCGKVICVDYGDKRITKLKDGWFPALIVHPGAQEQTNSKFDVKEEHLVKSFINGRFYQLSRKDTKEFTKEIANQTLSDLNSSASLKSAIEKALLYIEKDELPSNWDYDLLIGSISNSNEPTEDGNLSSDLEYFLDEDDNDDDFKTNEEKDRFVAQLYKFMDERGTPINKTPNVGGKDLDLYNLYRLVNKLGGYNRVTNKNGWKAIYNKLNLPSNANESAGGGESNYNQLKLAYKKFLLNFVDFYRKLGCTMVNTCLFSRTSARTARSERNWRTTSESKEPPKVRRKRLTGPDVKEEKTPDEDKTLSDKMIVLSPEEEDKGQISSSKKITKKPRKNARKKYKLIDADDSSVNGNEPEIKYVSGGESDSESDIDYPSKTPTIGKEISVTIGDRIRVKYGKGKQLKVYEAKVLKIDNANDDLLKQKYYVHYTGWNIRYDEWIKRNRIVEVVKDKSPKRRNGNKSKNKGVPLHLQESKEDVQKEPFKEEITKESKDEPKESREAFLNNNKRNRPSNLAISPKQEKFSKEDRLRKEQENKKFVAQQIKRSRQRSDCTEIGSENEEEKSETVEENETHEMADKEEEFDSDEDQISEKSDTGPKSKPRNETFSQSDLQPPFVEQTPVSDKEEESTDVEATKEDIVRELNKEISDTASVNSNSFDVPEIKVKSELANSLRCEEDRPLVVNENSEVSLSSVLSATEIETRPVEKINLINEDYQNKLVARLPEPKQQEQDEDVQITNGQIETNLPTDSNEEQQQSLKIISEPSKNARSSPTKQEDEAIRKRKTRKNKLGEVEPEELKPEEPVVQRKKKSLCNNSSNDEEEMSILNQNDNLNTNSMKRRRLSSRSLNEVDRSEVKTAKKQRSVSESVTTEILKVNARQGEPVLQDLDFKSDKVDEIESFEPISSAEIGVASFLLCKEEFPASPVGESNEEVDSKSNGDFSLTKDSSATTCASSKLSNNVSDSLATTSNPPSSELECSLTAKPKLFDSLQKSTKNEPGSQSKISNKFISNSKDTLIQSSDAIENILEANSDQANPILGSDVEKENDSETPKEEEDAALLDERSKTDECQTTKTVNHSSIDSCNTFTDHHIAQELINFSKSEGPPLQKPVDDQLVAISSPRKKRRGRIRSSSHCETTNNSCNQVASIGHTQPLVHSSNHALNSGLTNKDHRNIGCKTRGSFSRRVKHNSSNSGGDGGGIGNGDHNGDEPNSPGLLSSHFPPHIDYQPVSKYNFCAPLDDEGDSEKRIQILQDRLQDVRKTYMHLKSEVASLDRKRKKLKRKERSSPSSPGSSSHNSANESKMNSNNGKELQRSHSTSEGSSAEENSANNPNCDHLSEDAHSPTNMSHSTSLENSKSISIPALISVMSNNPELLSERV